ncbi:hypothetical protein CBS101457_002774 [Exobasidium rhododendri]|nr:hypothetical protein CBS101457_002774 [Exobasidium rhododendri]
MAAAFVPSHFEKLHRVLKDSIASPARVANSNDWYIAIDRSRAELVDLARAKKPNEAERKEIQSGKVTIEGKVHDLNDDFAQQTLALTQHLDVSERYAASLLQAGLEARAKWGRSAMEVACILFHRERLAAFQCLQDLIGGAATLSREDDLASRKLGAKMRQLVDSLLAGKVSLPDRILKEIDDVKSQMEKTKQILQSVNAQQQGLGDEIQLERIKMMRQERQKLGLILYLLSVSKCLSSRGILALGNWLALVEEKDQADAMVIYILTTLLNALELPSEEEELSSGLPQVDLIDDRNFVKQIHADLTTKAWKLPQIKSVAVLQWCLFLVEATKRSPGITNELKLQQDSTQKLFLDAISKDAFYFLVLKVLAFRQRQIDALEGEENDVNEAIASKWSEETEAEFEIDAEFQEYVLVQIQDLILSLTTVMLPSLRKLQRYEEDSAFASSRGTDYSRGGSEPPPRRYDIEALFDIVALLCRARPESGLPFWQGAEGKGTRFLNWAIEVRETGHQRALFEMLASLAGGNNCAWQAYSLLSSGDSSAPQLTSSSGTGFLSQGRLVSWSKLFDWVQQYIESYRASSSSTTNHQGYGNLLSSASHAMSPSDAILLRGFFRLLRNVAFYSVAAREALYQQSTYELVPRLFSLYTCPIIIEVKASILDALAAFAHPTGNHFAKITSQLWSMLENTQALGSAPSFSSGGGNQRITSSSSSSNFLGAFHDLQMVETPARIYPATTSFVNFLKSLVHVPSRQRDNPITAAVGSSVTVHAQQGIDFGLGQGQRAPGLDPYVSFVIETVFLPAGSREYSEPAERWRVTSACLDFVERCLASYDLSSLLSDEPSSTNGVALAALVSHSGFSIMKRILTGGKLLQEILSILNPNNGLPGTPAGYQIINTNRANTLYYSNSVRLCLRIIQRVLRIQDIFLQLLLPTLSDAVIPASGGRFAVKDLVTKVGHISSYSPLDTLLLHAHQSVVQVALYINCDRDDIALLAVRILGLLARSSAFSGVDRFGEMGYNRKMNRLVGLLEMSDEADVVRAGCVDRLEAQAQEVNTDLDSHVKATLALMQIAGEDDNPLDAEFQGIIAPITDANEAIRLAILDLLLVNTRLEVEAPNLAHLLLGFDLRAVHADDQIIPDPNSIDAPPSALHAILTLLRPDQDEATLTLSQRSPAFAEKCHQLIYNLCIHPFTSTATLRYLRTKESFFVKQMKALAYMPIKRTSTQTGSLGKLIRPDGGHLSTTVDSLVASLHIRSHLLCGVALELHTLCNDGMWAPAAQLIAVLLGHDSVVLGSNLGEDDDDYDDDDDEEGDSNDFNDGLGQRYEKRGMRILDLLSSFDFEWHDAREEIAQNPTILKNLDLSQALSANAAGPREFDIKSVISLLAAARQELERRGELNESKLRAEFDHDAMLILAHIGARNANRVIAFARRGAMQSWRNVLDMAFTRGNRLLKANSRSNIVFECLSVLLPRLSGSSLESDPALLDLIAGAVLGLLTELRHDQTDEDGVDQLSIDRLVATLRDLIAAMVESGTTMLARGNLYSALVNYIQLVKNSSSPSSSKLEGDEYDFDNADTVSEMDDDSVSFAGFSSIAGDDARRSGKRSSLLLSRSRTLLLSHAERLVPIIARDALDASDVWRTVSFTLFDRLSSLQQRSTSSSSINSSSRNVLLDILHRKGYLKSFVANLREMDLDLQKILRPDPSSLNALYVYESTMAFFNRLAQSKQGAEKLLEGKVFDVLSQVDFLQARPQQDYQYAQKQEYDELDSFVPGVASRYEALLLPALQLSVSILASLTSGSMNSNNSGRTPNLSLRLGGNSVAHSAPRQALSFLQAHRNTLLVSLKNATSDVVSLSTIDQAQLLIQLFTFVLPILDDEALAPPNPLSSFHNSILALSASFLYEDNWRSRVLPHTEVEREDASQLAPGSLSEDQESEQSVFDVHASQCVRRFLTTLLAYLAKASEYRGVGDEARKRVRPCFTASLFTHASNRGGIVADEFDNTGRYGLHSTRQPHIASLGIALASLDEFVSHSNVNLLQLDKVQGILESADSIRLDEWIDVLGKEVEEVAPAKRKSYAVHKFKVQQSALLSKLSFNLNCIEMLLILLFRHFDYYIELETRLQSHQNHHQTSTDLLATMTSSSLRRSVTPSVIGGGDETATLIREGNRIVSKVLEKLSQVIASLQSASGVASAEERRAFLSMTARKLQGTLLEKLDVI